MFHSIVNVRDNKPLKRQSFYRNMNKKTNQKKKKSEEGKINDLIFRELLKRGYSLEGNTRVWNIADSKLWYLTPEQAQGYLDLENTSSYAETVNKQQGENLMTVNVKEVIERIGDFPLNVVDLGCGDGTKAAILIKAIKKLNPNIRVRYCPIDISGYMVEKAIETFSKLKLTDEIVQFQYNISDFENLENVTPLLRTGEFKRNLFLLLGNTLGNFDIHELLYEIRSAMKEEDLFLIDTAVADEKVEERTKAHAENPKFNNFLLHIPLQLGLVKEDVEFNARFRNSRIEFYYIIKRDKTISFQEKKVDFHRGDQIIIAYAYKHDKDLLTSYFNMYFTEALIKLSKDKSQAFILCKK